MAKVKVPAYVAFPEVLDLSAFTGCHDDVYHLSSAIIHTGPTAYSGHYIAHIRVAQVSISGCLLRMSSEWVPAEVCE